MKNLLIRALSALYILVASSFWLAAQATIDFNLFEIEGFEASKVFKFDASYTEKFGIPVAVPFQINVPINRQIELIADGKPAGGGLAKFTFATKDEPRTFIENIQIVSATIPLMTDQDDPAAARVQVAVGLLTDQVFPAAVQGFQNAKILTVEEISMGGVHAVHLIGTYDDPTIGAMLLRLVAMPHPSNEQSYVTISNINLALVPVMDGPTLAASLSGRVMSSWTYLP